MTQKERMVELLEKADKAAFDAINVSFEEYYSQFADYLLSNGVIVPPCKVGDTVYSISRDRRLLRSDVTGFEVDESGIDFFLEYGSCSESEIGKRWFLTQKEAEQALKERENREKTS